MRKTKRRIEFGDFQTPLQLAGKVCSVLKESRISPQSIIEPTCGTGNFLYSALNQFSSIKKGFALDVNAEYIRTLKERICDYCSKNEIEIKLCDFFAFNWDRLIANLPEPILVIGNPPWVTNAQVGLIKGTNLPPKSNFQNLKGFDALTGKSNFDISEWMLIRMFNALNGYKGTIAMLCKSSVARKVLIYAWKNNLPLAWSRMYEINAKDSFDVSVGACLLVSSFEKNMCSKECEIFGTLDSGITPGKTIGFREGRLLANVDLYSKWKRLFANGKTAFQWRTGIKHDCSQVMELYRLGNNIYQNGLGITVELEDEYIYPMLKSSDLFHGRGVSKWVIVTQRNVGDDTSQIKNRAPMTWKYLLKYGELLDKRTSSIYKNRPRFSMFGIGEYSFSPWKVAVSGFYKVPRFQIVGTYMAKPILLDDTSNFLTAGTPEEAEILASILNSEGAKEFFSALTFWDMKRPITIELLKQLDIQKLLNDRDRRLKTAIFA
ncbi:MAG: SAM-dependent DNA methyltransferase [candidate division Zixibacteria bacterium]|nr:SAM-dependent DNA methyltransferase [candidate division Zixibacteria bacterium]